MAKILHRARTSPPNHLKLWNHVRNYVGLDWKNSWVDAGPPVMLTISWAQITCSRPNQKFRQIPVWWHNDCQTLFQHETKVTNRLRIHWDKFLGLFPPRTLLRTHCSRQEVIVANDRIPWNKKSWVLWLGDCDRIRPNPDLNHNNSGDHVTGTRTPNAELRGTNPSLGTWSKEPSG